MQGPQLHPYWQRSEPAADGTWVEVRSDRDVVVARQKGRELARRAGFTGSDLTLIATAISEVARNVVTFAGQGEIVITVVETDGARGVSIIASDRGPGIPDIAEALRDGVSTGGGFGIGLPGARRLMDEFHIHSKAGEGTTITMTKWCVTPRRPMGHHTDHWTPKTSSPSFVATCVPTKVAISATLRRIRTAWCRYRR